MKVVLPILLLALITFAEESALSVNEISTTTVVPQDQSVTNSLMKTNKNESRLAPSGGYYTRREAQAQVQKYSRLKKKGARRSIIGGSLTTLGFILWGTADKETTTTATGTQTSTNDPKGVVGGIMLMPGIPIAITGIIQLGVGSTKVAEYQNLFKDTQVGMTIDNERVGLVVTHAF